MKKKLFFLLTLLVYCIGQVWGEVTYTKMTGATSLDESAVYVIGDVDNYGCPTKTDGTSLSTTASDWVTWNAKNVEGGFVLYNGTTYITVPSSNAWGSGTTGATLTTNAEGIVTGTDGTGTTRILVKNNSNAYLRWYKSGQTKAYLYKVNAGTPPPTKELVSIAVSGTPTKTSYYVGDAFDTAGLVVTGTYSDASKDEITKDITWTVTPETLALGTTSVSVKAKVGDIESSAYTVNGLTVTEKPAPTYANTYTSGDGLLTTTGGTSASKANVKIDGTEYNAIKAGTGNVAGKIKMTVPAGTKTLHFHALGWKGETVKITVNGQTYTLTSDTGVTGSSPFILSSDPSTTGYFTLDTNNATDLEITFAATSGNRFVLFGVNAEAGELPTNPIISADNVDLAANATFGEIAYEITNPVMGKSLTANTEASWISNIQVATDKVTFTTTANTEATERTADITLKYEGATDKTVTVTQAKFVAQYTITWSVNGQTTEEKVTEGAAIKFKPATVPDGFTDYVFRGWTTSETVSGATEPTYVTEATATADITYYAVFAKKTTTGGTASLTKLDGTSTLSDGDKLAIFAHVGDNYYGMKHETVSTSYVNYYVLDKEPTYEAVTENDLNWWTLNEKEEGKWTLGDASNGYLVNASSNNLIANGTNTGSSLTIAWDDTNSAFTIKNGDRWIGCRSDLSDDNQYKFRGAGNLTSPTSKSSCYLDIYRVSTGTVTYSDWTTTLVKTAYTLNVSQYGYSTLYLDKAVEIPEGVTVYYCTTKDDQSLNAVKIESGYVPAYTGVVVEAKEGTYNFEYTDQQFEKLGILIGVFEDTSVQEIRTRHHNAPVYVLSVVEGTVGFYNYADTATLHANRAFLEGAEEQPPVKGFILDFDMETVGVSSVVNATNLKAGYDLQGRRANNAMRGLLIQNGKKILR